MDVEECRGGGGPARLWVVAAGALVGLAVFVGAGGAGRALAVARDAGFEGGTGGGRRWGGGIG